MSQDTNKKITSLAIRCFENEGKIDLKELQALINLALEDGEIDTDEKKALHQVFRFCSQEQCGPEVWQVIQELRRTYDI